MRLVVADLLRRHGARRHVELAEPVDGLGGATAAVPPDEPVLCDLTLEHVGDGIIVRGTVCGRWRGDCSRCLQPVAGLTTVHVDELYEPQPVAGETYHLEGETVDLEPLVRDALLLELPGTPLCDPACKGLCARCGADLNTVECGCADEEPDDRWAVLRTLDLSDRAGS